MNKVLFFTAVILVLNFATSSPQTHISFSQFTVENGLSQSSVTCIFQDRLGFMWFGTQDGLNRFDGYKFKVFKNNPSDSTTLSDNFIFGIYEATTGSLYFETQKGNFHLYNPATESFIRISKDSTDLKGASFNTLAALYEEPNGVRWSGGLSKPSGLTRLDTKSGKSTIYMHNPDDPSSLSDNKVYSVYRDRSNNLWVGTFNGLNRLDELTGKFMHYKNNPGDPSSLSDNWVWPIFEDSHGSLWLGTVRGGLSKFNPATQTFENYKSNANNPSSLSDNFIFSINEDRSGIIWVGTNTGGINYFHPSAQVFEHYTANPSVKNSISDNDIIAIHADSKNNYWIASRNGGLDKISFDKKQFRNYSQNPPYKLISNAVQVICEDRKGTLWLGTFSSGLMEFDPAKETYKLHRNIPDDTTSLSDNRIYSVIEDKDGYIWIGTYAGGINRLDPRTGIITRYRHNASDPLSLTSDNAWSMAEDNSGDIWIGTYGGGVSLYNKKTNSFTNFVNKPGDLNSLADNSIIRVFKDSKNGIWFGTASGLSKYDMSSSTFKNYSENDGLANNSILGILEDKKGFLWISTNNGLSRFDPQTETFRNYYKQDGLQGNEFNQNAFAKNSKTGHLLFGGSNGFNIFHPDSLKENLYPPPVVFTDFLRYNTDDEEGRPITEYGIAVRDSISLTYKDNIISLNFSALSFYNNFNNRYKYKLEGFNDNWIQLGNNHSVTFTNLSPGEYSLRVIGSNNDGIWNEEGASLFIEVFPPWWRTTYAYIAYSLILLGILLGARKIDLDRREQKALIRETELRIKATEAEKRVIEAENERKTKELEEARQLQLSMLPKELPRMENLEISAFMRTASEVGGDYYDFILQQNGTLNIAFGDATGHGLQAGTMVTLMKGFFTSDAAKLELPQFMNHCSNMIKEIKLGRILMSFSFMRIQENKLSVTSAGMPPIYYYSKDSGEVEEIAIQGIPLGAMRKFAYRTVEKEISSGDTILMLTDGLPEQMNKNEQMYDYSRVKSDFSRIAQCSPDEIINNLVRSGDEWMDGTVQSDDISFVVLKVK